jgi:hypothetical protein
VRASSPQVKPIGTRNWKKEELLGPLPPPPEFSDPIEAVRERIAKVIGKVTVPWEVRVWHPAVDRLLKEDETRREKATCLSISNVVERAAV